MTVLSIIHRCQKTMMPLSPCSIQRLNLNQSLNHLHQEKEKATSKQVQYIVCEEAAMISPRIKAKPNTTGNKEHNTNSTYFPLLALSLGWNCCQKCVKYLAYLLVWSVKFSVIHVEGDNWFISEKAQQVGHHSIPWQVKDCRTSTACAPKTH